MEVAHSRVTLESRGWCPVLGLTVLNPTHVSDVSRPANLNDSSLARASGQFAKRDNEPIIVRSLRTDTRRRLAIPYSSRCWNSRRAAWSLASRAARRRFDATQMPY